MASSRIYLDHNATSHLRPQARAAIVAAMDLAGNPSSVHAEGRRARALIETAREQVAALVGAKPSEVIFTSGGTEANTTVLRGGWDVVLLTGIEHDSVLRPADAWADRTVSLPVERSGLIDLAALDRRLSSEKPDGGRRLVTLQMANNETGIVQPIAEAAAIVRGHGAHLHVDAVQAAGKVPVDVTALDIDLMTLSAHKIGGPAGVGALVVRDAAPLMPLIWGGGQERGSRAGTENIAGICAFGAAAEAAQADLTMLDQRLSDYRTELETGARALAPGSQIIGADVARLPNTTCIALPGMRAETLVIALDLEGIAVSAGAACSSGKVRTSHVLTAMGLPPDIAGSAIRISTGWNTTRDDIDAFLVAFEKVTQIGRARKVA